MGKYSNYKGVSKILLSGKYIYWKAEYRTNEHNWRKLCHTEREAAIAYDIKMIEIGKEPVNILIRK